MAKQAATIKRRIAELEKERVRLGLSYSALSTLSGINRMTLWKITSGRVVLPRAETLLRWGETLAWVGRRKKRVL